MRPNIVIIMADQLRADLRKSNGYPLDTMPFLDEWACGGVDFCRACTSNPSCMPARVSMFTGRWSESHHVRSNYNAADISYTRDLLDILHAQGYITALCGKNHTHHCLNDFDFSAPYGHVGYQGEKNETNEEKQFADFLCELQSKESLAPSPGNVRQQHPYRIVNDALRFIDSLQDEKPFFLWLSFPEPHPPYQVPAPYFDMFSPEVLPPPQSSAEDLPAKGSRYVWLEKTWETIFDGEVEKHVARARSNYLGMMRLIDDQLRRFINEMEVRHLDENTVFLFLADHGDFAGEYGLTRKGPDLSQVLTRIPMVWRGNGIQSLGKEDASCVNIVDVLPTVCTMLGCDIPKGCQGKSLLQLLRGEPVPPHEFDMTFAEAGYGGHYFTKEDRLSLPQEGATKDYTTFDTLNTWTQCGQVRMVRKGNYTLQMDMMGNGYLYDLSTDPVETKNLYSNPDYQALRAEMLEALSIAMLRAVDPLPFPRMRYRFKEHPMGWWEDAFSIDDPGPAASSDNW